MNPEIKTKLENISLQQIDPSPYQKRKYFDEEKLKELATSIETDGLIEPVITRPKGKRYELIAGSQPFPKMVFCCLTNLLNRWKIFFKNFLNVWNGKVFIRMTSL